MAEHFTTVLGSDLRIIFSFLRPFLSWLSQMRLAKHQCHFKTILLLCFYKEEADLFWKLPVYRILFQINCDIGHHTWYFGLLFAVGAGLLWSVLFALYYSMAEFHSDCYPQGPHEEEIHISWDYPTEQRNEINNVTLLVLSTIVAHRAFQGSVSMG